MSTENNQTPQPDVVAGLDLPTEACITRPDFETINLLIKFADELAEEKKVGPLELVDHFKRAIAYIHHLEQHVTNGQNKNNLSLNSLRAERDALRDIIKHHGLCHGMCDCVGYKNAHHPDCIHALVAQLQP